VITLMLRRKLAGMNMQRVTDFPELCAAFLLRKYKFQQTIFFVVIEISHCTTAPSMSDHVCPTNLTYALRPI
jgi:hypothetical protein